MFIFTDLEHPYPFPDEEALRHYPGDHPARKLGDIHILFSNRFFDPEVGRRLHDERMAEVRFAEEIGFDGITFHEHHNVPFQLQAFTNLTAALIAHNTSRIKIILGETNLPLWDNPVRLAEEIAMLDIVSGGRIVITFFRGAGHDALSFNVNPAHLRERFAEAHDLLVKTWSEPGPFRWEGDHYQFRVVNPWVLPLQKPHPRLQVFARSSNASARFAATHGYPVSLGSYTTEQNKRLQSAYAETAEEAGFAAGPEHFAMYLDISVAETEKEALKIAENSREFFKDEAHNWSDDLWMSPTGYSTRQEKIDIQAIKAPKHGSVADRIRSGVLIAGTPEQVVEQIGSWLSVHRPGMLGLGRRSGEMSHGEFMNTLRMLGEAVLPDVRKIGEGLGLHSPDELNSPVSLAESARR